MTDFELIVKPLQELTGTQTDNTQQMIAITAQLAALYARMDARMTALENERTGATILHKDVKTLMLRIRDKAAAESEHYHLDGKGEKLLRSMIKRTVLQRYGIKDLHDLPLNRQRDAQNYIEAMPCYKHVLKVRQRLSA